MRVERLRAKMAERDLEGMLITDPLNRRYLSGFSGTAGWLLVTEAQTMLAVDFRYYERAEREAPAWEQFPIKSTYPDALVEMAAQTGVRRLGVEGDHLTVAAYQELCDKLPEVDLVPVEKMVLSLRAYKDAGEIASIRAAVASADEAFAHLCQVICPGMTEKEVAWVLESHMRQQGVASGASFEIIVAAGPNGAMPHAFATDRRIEIGEPIVMDFGATVDGYRSDITRTVCLGQAGAQYKAIWQLVLEAQRAVEETLRPGMTGKEADAIARDLFAEAGYEDEFGHGLGHGVGLAIHEDPRLSARAEAEMLEPGMVFTVEPGLYVKGWGGVRIEDIVVLGEERAQVLTQAPKVPVLEV